MFDKVVYANLSVKYLLIFGDVRGAKERKKVDDQQLESSDGCQY